MRLGDLDQLEQDIASHVLGIDLAVDTTAIQDLPALFALRGAFTTILGSVRSGDYDYDLRSLTATEVGLIYEREHDHAAERELEQARIRRENTPTTTFEGD